MGHKVNPKIFRIPLIKEWESKWFAEGSAYRRFLKNDLQIRKFLSLKLKSTGVSKINIEKTANLVKIIIYTAKPGLIIGRGGVDVEKLKKEIQNKFLTKGTYLELNILEEPKPMLSAQVVLEGVITDLEKRVPYRRIMKKAIDQLKRAGAKGGKIILGGRLDGVEIARSEKLIWGKLPLHTLRADISYARGNAFTIYGTIGVKIWIYRGEIFRDSSKIQAEKA